MKLYKHKTYNTKIEFVGKSDHDDETFKYVDDDQIFFSMLKSEREKHWIPIKNVDKVVST